jgi:hypothetical protein
MPYMWRTIWRKFLEPMFGGGNLLSGKPPIVCGGPPIGAGGPDIICCGGRLERNDLIGLSSKEKILILFVLCS